jgi:uncharacterized protein YoxC
MNSADVLLVAIWDAVGVYVTTGGIAAIMALGVFFWRVYRFIRKSAILELEYRQTIETVAKLKLAINGEDGTNGLNGRVKDIESDLGRGASRMDALQDSISDVEKKLSGIGKSMDRNFRELEQSVARLEGALRGRET